MSELMMAVGGLIRTSLARSFSHHLDTAVKLRRPLGTLSVMGGPRCRQHERKTHTTTYFVTGCETTRDDTLKANQRVRRTYRAMTPLEKL